jgi:acyl carrier protein
VSSSVRERIEGIVRDALADDSVTLSADTTAADVPGWDSLAHVNIMFMIEQDLGVRFTDEEFTGFVNVGELERMIASKRSEA